jgi:hypothetical protein
LNKKLQLFQVN